MVFQGGYWGCCWVWSASFVQLGLLVWLAGHHGGLGTGGLHGGRGGLLHVQFVQLGVHPVQASRLGPLLACSGVQLGLCLSSVYLALWMLILAY